MLALKDNQPQLREAVAAKITSARRRGTAAGFAAHVTVETNHGRRRRRECYVLPALRTLPGVADWAKLVTIVMVLRVTHTDHGESGQISSYLSSPPPQAKRLAQLIRQHWSIENQLHWVLDVTFTQNASRIRRQHAPQNSAMLRRLAISILSATLPCAILCAADSTDCLSTESLEGILRSFIEK